MDEYRIQSAINTIKERKAALKWFEEYAAQFEARNNADAKCVVSFHTAGSCPGAREAEAVASAYARVHLPEIMQSAMSCCRNDIEIARQTLKDELFEGTGA